MVCPLQSLGLSAPAPEAPSQDQLAPPRAAGCAPGHLRTAGRRTPVCAHHTPAALAAPPRPSLPPRRHSGFSPWCPAGLGPCSVARPPLGQMLLSCVAALPWAGRKVQTTIMAFSHHTAPRAQAENSAEANLTRHQQRLALCRSPFSLQTSQGGGVPKLVRLFSRPSGGDGATPENGGRGPCRGRGVGF